MGSKEKSVLQTLLYADIFGYPLSTNEILRFYNGDTVLTLPELIKSLKLLIAEEKIINVERFYVLKGKGHLVAIRKKRKKINKEKLEKALKVGKMLFKIPSILLVGISGGVALENADDNDDIDFFIIVKNKTLWTSRLFALLLLEMTGNRRKRSGIGVRDKICLNMIVDESDLSEKKKRRNLYVAHEIVQLAPLFIRDDIYERYKKANQWVLDLLPNGFSIDHTATQGKSLFYPFYFLEPFAKVVQLWYMKSHKGNEEVEDTRVAFHPFDYQEYVLSEYAKRRRQYNV